AQIKEKNYPEKYLGGGRRILLVGVNFDSEKGQIKEYRTEELV
ncbi:MAG TPA: hypothetical protein DDZ11_02400, partial [Lentisphaeria bacterium]|nr:hypothetical protein [Lentisphaeria bacterium]